MNISYALLSGGLAKRFGKDKTLALYKEKPFFTYSLFCGSHKNTDGFMMAHFNDIPSAALDGDIEEIIEEIENNE